MDLHGVSGSVRANVRRHLLFDRSCNDVKTGRGPSVAAPGL